MKKHFFSRCHAPDFPHATWKNYVLSYFLIVLKSFTTGLPPSLLSVKISMSQNHVKALDRFLPSLCHAFILITITICIFPAASSVCESYSCCNLHDKFQNKNWVLFLDIVTHHEKCCDYTTGQCNDESLVLIFSIITTSWIFCWLNTVVKHIFKKKTMSEYVTEGKEI